MFGENTKQLAVGVRSKAACQAHPMKFGCFVVCVLLSIGPEAPSTSESLEQQYTHSRRYIQVPLVALVDEKMPPLVDPGIIPAANSSSSMDNNVISRSKSSNDLLHLKSRAI
jgi:hypothetical protein